MLVTMSDSVDGPVVVTTALGYLRFDLVDGRDRLSNVRHRIEVFPIFPRLAEEVGIPAVAVLLTVSPRMSTKRLHFRCRSFPPPAAKSDIDTGQHLRSQAWGGDGHLAHIGTEDTEALEIRLPRLPI